MSDAVVVQPAKFVVVVEQPGLAPIVCDFEDFDEAKRTAVRWLGDNLIDYMGKGPPPNFAPVHQFVRLRAPYRVLVLSRSEYIAQAREMHMQQMAARAQAAGQVPIIGGRQR